MFLRVFSIWVYSRWTLWPLESWCLHSSTLGSFEKFLHQICLPVFSGILVLLVLFLLISSCCAFPFITPLPLLSRNFLQHLLNLLDLFLSSFLFYSLDSRIFLLSTIFFISITSKCTVLISALMLYGVIVSLISFNIFNKVPLKLLLRVYRTDWYW